MLAGIIQQHTREQCATVALSRVQQPPVIRNLLGPDDSEAQMRRRRCHHAALPRFLMPSNPAQPIYPSETRKRRSDDKTEVYVWNTFYWIVVMATHGHRCCVGMPTH